MNKKRFKRVYIEITNYCNLQCRFCSVDHHLKRNITLEQFEFILQTIDSYCDYVYLHIKGEPLLHPQLMEILDLCLKYDKKVQLVTNASLLHRYGMKLKGHPAIRKISLSLHSISEQLDPSTYMDQVLSFLKLEATHVNIELRFWNKQYVLSSKLHREMIDKLSKLYQMDIVAAFEKSDSLKVKDHVYISFDSQFVWPSLENACMGTSGTCYGTRHMIGILVNGDVVPCCLDSGGVITFGNIYKNPLSEMLESRRFKMMQEGFRQRKLVEPLCQRCGYCRRF